MFDLDNLAKTGDKQLDDIMQQFWEGVQDDAKTDKPYITMATETD